jgi:predicted phage baseplate assembly protein
LYRKGIGLEGGVRAGQLTTALKVPPGIRSVTNPLAASGAADPEARDAARRNSPITVRTLDRTVSLRDYQDFAMAFAGIDKALASFTWDGLQRRVLLTVAGSGGAVIPQDSQLLRNLIDALAGAGQPTVTFDVLPFVPVRFRAHLKVKVHADHLPEKVLAAVTDALHAAFDFAAREFGQAVSQSEVIAVVQAVPGVVAVDLDALYRTTAPNNTLSLHPRLPALGPRPGADGRLQGAEVLVLEPGPITVLGQMT